MEKQIHSYKNYQLEFLQFGEGPKVILAFHGFGRKAEDFLLFEKLLHTEYTVYSFNFFHHGNSVYPKNRIEKDTLKKEELWGIIHSFLQAQKIERFSLMGYSMGGKICLSLIENFASQIDELFLFAPDGIKINFWYKFTSKNRIGNLIYKRILYHPTNFFRFLKFLKRIRLITDKMHRFVMYNLETEEKRKLVFTVWMTLRLIEPKPRKCAQLIQNNKIQCGLFFGKYDQIIKVKTGKWFSELIQQKESLHIVECGHNLYMPATVTELENFLSGLKTKI